MIRGVIFDLDGVLVTTDELHFRAWQRLADEEGIPFGRRINERLRGVSRMASLAILLERATRSYDDRERAALADRKNARYRELLESLTPADVLPGARQTLAELKRRGIRIAVASSSRNASTIMDRVGLPRSTFDAVVDGNDITHSKPDPEEFLLAARRLGLAPAECLVVEDATAGIEAGRRAGMHVFGIGTPETLPGAKRTARSLGDVTVGELLDVT
jgi:beta-phosphoglucomutase